MHWRWRASDVAKDGDGWPSLSDRDGLAESEWCADRHQLRAGFWMAGISEDGLPYLVMKYVNGVRLEIVQHVESSAVGSADARRDGFGLL